MQFSIKNITHLRADDNSSSAESSCIFDKSLLPKLPWVAPMQRRRLSPFTKMALHCGYEAASECSNIDVVFSSRHGDLHKTSTLLDSLAEHESLSPTAFSMSVHNASAGLLSILTQNTAASNTISAGRNTFMMALVDAYARINSGMSEQVLVIHCDQALPDDYLNFSDEQQIDHAIAFVMSKNSSDVVNVSIDMLSPKEVEESADNLPLGLAFLDAVLSKNSLSTFHCGNKQWEVRLAS